MRPRSSCPDIPLDLLALTEIRFEATYGDVIGQGIDTSGDFTPPTPAVMSFEVPPTAISETAITMTATTALDDNGVQYRFHNVTLDTYSLRHPEVAGTLMSLWGQNVPRPTADRMSALRSAVILTALGWRTFCPAKSHPASALISMKTPRTLG